MEPKVYLRYRDVHGQASDAMQLETALRGLDRSAMLRLLSGISFSLDLLIGDSSETTQTAAIKTFFPPTQASQMLAKGGAVFHRHQLLFLIQEVIKHCPDWKTPKSIRMEELGQIFLMANDQLFPPSEPSDSSHDGLLRSILDFVPISEANLFTSGLLKVGRSHLMVTKFAEARRGEAGFFDISALFHQATGVQFKTFEALMVGIFGKLVHVERVIKEPKQFGIPLSYFDNLPPEPGEVSAFFRLISATPEEYATTLQTLSPLPNDFRVIRDRPLVRIGDLLCPLDAQSGLEKFETAAYWSVLGHLPDEQKKAFPSFWGQVFEDYVLWLLTESCKEKPNRLCRNPKYADDPQQQVCDAIVACGSTAIFVEVKGNTITSQAKYGSDVDKLRSEIERKYVGTEHDRKGIRQLVAAIQNTCSGEHARGIEGLDLRSISTVIPLLITRDDIGGYFGVNAYLKARFKEIMGRAKYQKSITPCLCICSDTLEKLTPYLADTALADILSSRIRNDRTLRAPFFARIGTVLQHKNKGGERQPTLLKDATLTVAAIAREVFQVSESTLQSQSAGSGGAKR